MYCKRCPFISILTYHIYFIVDHMYMTRLFARKNLWCDKDDTSKKHMYYKIGLWGMAVWRDTSWVLSKILTVQFCNKHIYYMLKCLNNKQNSFVYNFYTKILLLQSDFLAYLFEFYIVLEWASVIVCDK